MSKASVQLGALGTVTMCAFCLAALLLRSIESVSSNSWPTTTAEVEVSYKTNSRSNWARIGHTYAVLLFKYNVEGTTYRSSRVSFFDFVPISPANDTTYALETYPRGRSVTCRYNPNDPTDAVIENDIPPRVMVFVILSTVVGIVAGCVAAWPDSYIRLMRVMSPKPEDVARVGEW